MEIPEDSLFLQQIAAVIQQLCDTNSDLRSVNPTIFDSVARPSMTIHSYLVRIRRYTKFDTVCFLVALAYLRKLCSQHGAPFCVTHHNIHRMLITSVLASSKANDGAQRPRRAPFALGVRDATPLAADRFARAADQSRRPFPPRADVFHANVFMAQCGGITNEELNKLEVEMCERMQWRLMIDPDELLEMLRSLGEPNAPLWRSWGTEACQRRRLPLVSSTPDMAAAMRTTPPDSPVGDGRPGHQRSLSLGRVLGRSPAAPAAVDGSQRSSPEALAKELPSHEASPRSVLSRTMSFGSFLGSFTALVSMGSKAESRAEPPIYA